MSSNFFRVNKGVELNPSHAPTSPQNGQIYLGNSDNKVKTVGPTQAVDYNTGSVIELNPKPIVDPISGFSYVTIFTQSQSFLYKANPLNAPGSGGYHRFSVNDEPVMTVNYSDVVLEAPSVGGATKLTFKYNSNASPGNLSTVSILPENNPSGELITAEVRLPVTVSGDVLVGRTTTDTFTNKTFDIDDNSFEIGGTQVTTSTGSGGFVLNTSPTLITPNLGVPSSITLTNATGLPVSGLSGVGADMQTFLTTPSSANLAAAITDGTGTGAAVFANTPTLITPIIGSATATSITGSNSADLIINSDPEYDLEMQGNNVVVKSFDQSSTTASGNVDIKTGDQSGTTFSGTINIKTGDTVDDGSGSVQINTGNTDASPSGNISISTGTTVSSTRGNVTIDGLSVNIPSETTNFGAYDSGTNSYPLQMSCGPVSTQTILEFQASDNFIRSRNELTGGTKNLSFSTGVAGDFSSPPTNPGNSGGISFTTGSSVGTATGASGGLIFITGDTFGSDQSGNMLFITGTTNGSAGSGSMYFETGINTLGLVPRGNINFSGNDVNIYIGDPSIATAGDLINISGYTISRTGSTPRSLILDGGAGGISVKSPSTLSASYDFILPSNPPTSEYVMGYNGTNMDWYKFRPAVSTNSSLTASGTVTINTSELDLNQIIVVSGASAAITLSTTPFGSVAPTADGTIIRLIGGSDTNTVTLVNSNTSKGAALNGPATLGQYNCITLQYVNSLDRYVEISRNF